MRLYTLDGAAVRWAHVVHVFSGHATVQAQTQPFPISRANPRAFSAQDKFQRRGCSPMGRHWLVSDVIKLVIVSVQLIFAALQLASGVIIGQRLQRSGASLSSQQFKLKRCNNLRVFHALNLAVAASLWLWILVRSPKVLMAFFQRLTDSRAHGAQGAHEPLFLGAVWYLLACSVENVRAHALPHSHTRTHTHTHTHKYSSTFSAFCDRVPA